MRKNKELATTIIKCLDDINNWEFCLIKENCWVSYILNREEAIKIYYSLNKAEVLRYYVDPQDEYTRKMEMLYGNYNFGESYSKINSSREKLAILNNCRIFFNKELEGE